RAALKEWLSEVYVDASMGVDNLNHALTTAHYWALCRACWGAGDVSSETECPTGLPFERWPELADKLLTAAEKHPQNVLPALLPFFVRLHREYGSYSVTYNSRSAAALFEEDRLLTIFAKHECAPLADANVRLGYECVRRAAVDEGVRGGEAFTLRG